MARAKKSRARASSSALRIEYDAHLPLAQRLCDCIREQFLTLLAKNQITLGVPLEFRVKDWISIEEKLTRKSLSLQSLGDLSDIVGIRAILLFRRDLASVDQIIRENFMVIASEDTGSRLEETQFGYQSQHYIVSLLQSWTSIPSYADLGNITAEIQVRTLAQHIWAAASHKLQYKREESVPPPLRRAIYRVSALLETVDLEFSRVLDERDSYIREETGPSSSPGTLNVDLLRAVMDETLPSQNKSSAEAYGDILEELFELGINTDVSLREMISQALDKALEKDKEVVETYKGKLGELNNEQRKKVGQGAFMSHTGLMRWVMRAYFGESKADPVINRSLSKQN